MNNYPLLAIESSDILCGAAVSDGKHIFEENSIEEKNVHSEKMLQIIDELLLKSSIHISSVKTVAISNGPGSFTGLRIGYAMAKAIAYANNAEIITVPTIQAIALELFEKKGLRDFVICTKVNAKELYAARFTLSHKIDILQGSISIIANEQLKDFAGSLEVYGNFQNIDVQHFISYPTPRFVAQWAMDYGVPLKKEEFAFAEPDYKKPFFVKEVKSV